MTSAQPIPSGFLSKPLYMFMALILASVLLLKLLVALGAWGPVTFGDEYIYVASARAMLGGPEHYDPHYPPLYSVVLMPAMLFGEHFYQALLVINTLVSSLILVPMWLIARRMLPLTWTLCLLIAASLLPLQFVYPRLIMSENLFSTLFLFVVYLFLRLLEEKRAGIAIACGVSIALCLLTRYFALLLLPVLVGVWTWNAIVAVRRREESLTPWLAHAAIVFAAALITWTPWLAAGLTHGWPLTRLVGLTAKTMAPGEPPATGFAAWLMLYGFYWVLMLAPVLSLIVLEGFRRLRLREWPDSTREKLFTNLLLLFTAIFVLVAAHHSWKVPYNAELPNYILGRYLVHLLAAWLIWVFVIANRVPQRGSDSAYSLAELVAAAVATCGLLALAYRGLILGEIVDTTPWFVMYHNGLDANVFRAGAAVLLAAGASGLLLLWVIWRRPHFIRAALLTLACSFYAYASIYDVGKISSNGRHGREIAHIAREKGLLDPGSPHLDVVNALKTRKYASSSLTYSLKFWGLSPKAFKLVETDPGETSSSVLILSDAPLSDEELELVHRYGKRYYVYLRRSASS